MVTTECPLHREHSGHSSALKPQQLRLMHGNPTETTWHTQAKSNGTRDAEGRGWWQHELQVTQDLALRCFHARVSIHGSHHRRRAGLSGSQRRDRKETRLLDPKDQSRSREHPLHTHGPLRSTKFAILHKCGCHQTAHEKTRVASVPPWLWVQVMYNQRAGLEDLQL